MTKQTKTMIVSSAVVVLVIAIAMVVVKSRTKTKLANQPESTVWRDSSLWVSPFTAVRFDGDNVLVTYLQKEYQLSAINGVSVSDILGYSRDKYRDGWQKRVAEDLLAVLGEMGQPVYGDKVSLSLIDSANGEIKEIADAKMTSANRSSIHQALASTVPAPKRAQ